MSKSPYLSNPNILAHPDRIVQKVELDMTAQDSYLAGSPISAEGKLANDANAIGILLYDVHKAIGGRTGVVVIFGRIKQDVAAEHSGITISAEAKAALIDITFTGDGCRMGGGGLTELPEGYPYKEQSETVLLAEETLIPTADAPGTYLASPTATFDIEIGKEYIVVFNGVEYKTTAFDFSANGVTAASLSDTGSSDCSIFTVTCGKINDNSFCSIVTFAGDTYTISVKQVSKTIHTMAPEFLPEPQTVTFTMNAEDGGYTASHTGAEIAEMAKRGTVVGKFETNGYQLLFRYIGGMNGAACFISGFANDNGGNIYVYDVAANSTSVTVGAIGN